MLHFYSVNYQVLYTVLKISSTLTNFKRENILRH